jgi:hypothetical protein
MANPIMAAEVQALRLPSGDVCVNSPSLQAEYFAKVSLPAVWEGTDFTFCGNARFKKRPPNDQRLTVLERT